MRIVILGAGSIGRLFGYYFGRADHRVTLVDPDREVVEALNADGIGFLDRQAATADEVTHQPVEAVEHARDVREADLVLLAVKSFNTLAAARDTAHLVSPAVPIVTLQTGLGNLELLEKVVDRKAIIGGFTFMSAAALGPGIVRQGGTGKTYLGEIDGRAGERIKTLAEIFTSAGLQCSGVEQIVGRLWCKVIVFSAINALSAILQVKNGRLLESMESLTLMKRLVDEGRAVARAHAVDLVFDDLYQLLFDGCRRSGENISSMLQDILSGKRTEIDAQSGALVSYGEQAGIGVPTQQTMVELIRLLEKKAAATRAGEGAR